MFLDLFIGIIAFSAFLYGFSKGIIRVVFAVIAFIVGGLIALRYTPALTIFLADTFTAAAAYMPVIAFVLLFFGSVIIIKLIAKTIEGSLKIANINILNKTGGGLVFALVCVILISAILQFVDAAGLMSDNAKNASKVFPYIENLPAKGAEWLKQVSPYVKDLIDGVMELFEKTEK
ncbi:MAG: CvpA family protein [Bacteroidota bacterium]